MKAIFLLIFLSYFFGQSIFAQASLSRSDYIHKYHKLAIREMHRSGIPASITLAQGILESGNGNSRLARDGNNHFGIKCHENWDGKTIYADDDLLDECFRAYQRPKKSFRDHSLFLASRSRYDHLFVLDPRDFKSWARGLQDAGYATNNEYAVSLINIIEDNNLNTFDTAIKKIKSKRNKYINRLMLSPNGPCYVVLKEDESIESFALENGLSINRLLRLNDLIFSSQINAGDRIYIERKGKSFSRKLREFSTHRLSEDENAHFVSQLYSIQLSVLYRLNNWAVGYQPKNGDLIKLK